jgi:hypothetical protein
MRVIQIRRLTTGSIFKLIFFGAWLGSLPVFFVMGVLAAFGVELLSWNDEPVRGVGALIGGPMLGLFITSGSALFVASLTALGHWIMSKGKGLRLYCELEEDCEGGE